MKLINTKEASVILGVSVARICQLIKNKELKTYRGKFGSAHMLDEDEVRAFKPVGQGCPGMKKPRTKALARIPYNQ